MRYVRRLASLLTVGSLCCSSAHADLGLPGPHQAGRKDVTVTRPNGSTFTATVHYPALTAGINTPFDAGAGPYPIVSFGHGFVQPVTQYQSTLAHLATHGFIAIASQSQGGLFPSHAAFAADLGLCVDWVIAAGTEGGPFAGGVAGDRMAFSGHSMGGGAALLAAKNDPRELAVAVLAAAETNPSAIAAAATLDGPVRLIVGSEDTIVPPKTSAGPMYAALSGPKQLATIVGGFHCGFTDGDFLFCDSGSISRAEQLQRTRALLTQFLTTTLKWDGPCSPGAWAAVWGPDAPDVEGVLLERDAGFSLTARPAVVSAPPGGTVTIDLVVTNDRLVQQAFALCGVRADPSTTAELAPGTSATSQAVVTMPLDAETGGSLVVSAQSDRDHATRAFVPLTLAPTGSGSPADLNADGAVNGEDLGILLAQWGSTGSADLDGNRVVDAADLAIFLGAWK